MKVLIASINFAPDHSGIGVYSTDFPIYLAERGKSVTMVTGFSYYPAWRKLPEDRGRLFATETYRGVRVLRGYLYVPRKVSTLARLVHEATFCLFAFLNCLRAGRQDVVVVFTPPFVLGLVGRVVAWLWRCPLVINAQDLPLDAAAALGMVKPGLFSRVLGWLERMIYRSADDVVTISSGMRDILLAKGVATDKCGIVPNWIKIGPRPEESGGFFGDFPVSSGRFRVGYAGNLGIKQGVESLLKLAKALEGDDRFWFFVFGDGADKDRLLGVAEKLKLTNLTFGPLLDPSAYGRMLAEVDVVFVGQRSGAGNNFFPSKLLGLMAQAKPLLVSADPDSELSQSVRKWQCGSVAAFEDTDSLARNLSELAADECTLRLLGSNGAEAVKAFERGKVLADWRERIGRIVLGK